MNLCFAYSQDDFVVNSSRFLQKANPSYFGYNSVMKVGVLYNSIGIDSYNVINNKYAFGSIDFDNKKFSLGIHVNSFQIENIGLNSSDAGLTYVYKIQLGNELYFLPSITAGFSSRKLDPSGLIFGDQLNASTGFINLESNDSFAGESFNVSDFGLDASFILHNDIFLVGLSLQNLKGPNLSFSDEPQIKPLSIGLQGAYEFDINPYDRRFLPRYSFLMTYMNVVYLPDSMYFYLSQELQLGEFSIGISEQAGYLTSGYNLNNFGINFGLSLENFDFGAAYNFPIQKTGKTFSPSTFEIYVVFDFSIYRRNNRGNYKRLTTDNYY